VSASSPCLALVSDLSRGHFFGQRLRQLRHQHTYINDKDKDRKREQTDRNCQRTTRITRDLNPGFLTVQCEHGICVGFSVMQDHESESMVFELFFTRCEAGRPLALLGDAFQSANRDAWHSLAAAAPAMLIYDRACKLHLYCMRREPRFFASTMFRIDITHASNHTGCGEGYNPKTYRGLKFPSSKRAGAWINTQHAEQLNSDLKFIRSMAAYMRYENFMLYTKVFIALRNRRKQAKAPFVAE
jgi:hypothetical protein